MSMSVEQRRTEVLKELQLPTGKVRLVKASNKYDRRRRHLALEWCPPEFVDTDLEEHAYRVLEDWWPASNAANRASAEAALTACFHLLRVQAVILRIPR